MKKEYKSIFDKIEPKRALEERAMCLDGAQRRAMPAPRRMIAIAAVIAIMVAGSSLGAYQLSTKPLPITENTSGSLLTGNSFTIVAYAKNDDTMAKPISDVSTPIAYQIFCKSIKGMSEAEIEKVFEQLKARTNSGLNSNEYSYRRSISRFDNVLAGCAAWDYFDIDVDNPEEVKNITVSNESKYGELVLVVLDKEFDDNGELIGDGSNFAANLIMGSSVSLSGDRFARCKRLEKKCQKLFCIDWEVSDALWQEIDNNPDMDFSLVNDTLTFTVEYKDGSTAQSKVNITFGSDGQMSAATAK